MNRFISMIALCIFGTLLFQCKLRTDQPTTSNVAESVLRTEDVPLSKDPNRILYQVYVRAFYDNPGNPDGTGDLTGLQNKLNYFKELGIDAILLMPIVKNSGGMGYIPKDYFQVDPDYGNFDDFKKLSEAARNLDIKIMVDLPLNHISDDSEWFKQGYRKNCSPQDSAYNPNNPNNVYCDFFYFVADPSHTYPYKNWHKPWRWNETTWEAVWYKAYNYNPQYHRPEYYYATFAQGMPDLKFWDFEKKTWNKNVVEKVDAALKLWSSVGVDAFRVDAAKHFIEGTENNAAPAEPRNLEFLKNMLLKVRETNKSVSFAGEIWSDYGTIEQYFGPGMDMAFDFPFMETLRYALDKNDPGALKGIIEHFEAMQDRITPGQRIVFAGNHDVTRLMTLWNDDEKKVRVAHFITLMTPYIPMIFYADELGMHGKVKRPDNESNEEYVRTVYAFPWDGSQNGGFPGPQPWVGFSDNYKQINLEKLKGDPQSLWHYVKNLIALRKKFPLNENTTITLNRNVDQNILSYTMSTPNGSGNSAQCRTVAINLNNQKTVKSWISHIGEACKNQPSSTVQLSEGASRENGNSFEFKPFGKVVLDN